MGAYVVQNQQQADELIKLTIAESRNHIFFRIWSVNKTPNILKLIA